MTVVCRAAADTCDAAETCTGTSGTCPVDTFQPEGTICGSGPAACSAQDACDGSGTCLPHDFADNTPCNDGNACTIEDACSSTVCAGIPRTCEDDNECTSNQCDPTLGCYFDPVSDGTSCNDANACTVEDACLAGECRGNTRNCNDENPCSSDSCDSMQGCLHDNLADDTACSDQDACTADDVCRSGECLGTTVECDDSNPCTTEYCDMEQGCLYENLPDDSSCDDGNACTVADACLSGECYGETRDCNDDNICTDDSCDPVQGCQNENLPDETVCDDEDACTIEDACFAGECRGNTRDCDDENPCTINGCDVQEGCQSESLPDWTSCDSASEGDFQCVDGQCLSISDGEQCVRPISLEVGVPMALTTEGFLDTYAEHPPCLTLSTLGPEVFFEVQPEAGEYRVTLTPEESFNPVLLLLNECAPQTCPTIVNAGSTGEIEQFAPVIIDEDGASLLLVVDSTDLGEVGAFTILFEKIETVDGDMDEEALEAEEEFPADEDADAFDEPWEQEEVEEEIEFAELEIEVTTEEELSGEADVAEITEEDADETAGDPGTGGDDDVEPGVIDDGCHSIPVDFRSGILWVSLFLLGLGLRVRWNRRSLKRD